MWWLPRFMRKNKGSISLFMAIIMLSMFTISAVVNDGARIRVARTVVQSAADSAALSVLAKYDNSLKDKYGLFTLDSDNSEAVISDFTDFFVENLSSEYPLSSDFKQAIAGFVSRLGLSSEPDKPVDMYDYDLAETSVNLAYSIIEPQVLQTQMAEFTKYRGFISMMDVVDLSELTEKAEESSEELEKIKETVSTESGTAGSGYKQDVEDATTAYYELTQKLRSLNYAADMCDSCKNQYATGLSYMKSEWTCITANTKNIRAYLDGMNSNVNNITSYASGTVQPALAEYERLQGILNQKQSELNTANANLSTATANKQAADNANTTATQNADKKTKLKRCLSSIGGIGVISSTTGFFDLADSLGVCSFGKGDWRSEKMYYQSIKGDLKKNYSFDEYVKYRTGKLIDPTSPIQPPNDPDDADDLADLYKSVKQDIQDAITEIDNSSNGNNAEYAASAAKQAADNANAVYTARKNEQQAAQQAFDTAQQNLNNQLQRLNEIRSTWDSTVQNNFDSTISGKITNINKIINGSFTLNYCQKKGRSAKLTDGGVKDGITVVKSAYTDAKSKLDTAISKTNAYISEVKQRIASASADDDTSMDQALLEDAQTALAELENIKQKSTGQSPSIDNWLNGESDYTSKLNTELGKISTAYESFKNTKNNSGSTDAYNYLKQSIKYAVNYDGSGGNNISTYWSNCISYKNSFKSSYYDKEYIYETKNITIKDDSGNEVSESKKNSVASNLFSLFSDDETDDQKSSGLGTAEKATISTDDNEVLPTTLYNKDSTYHTDDTYKTEDYDYIDRIKAGLNLNGSMLSADVDDETADIDQNLLDDISNLKIDDTASSQSGGFDVLKKLMDGIGSFTNNMTDSLLVNFYDMSTFKSRVSKSSQEWKSFYEEKGIYEDLKNNNYNFDKKRYSDDNKELNLYFKDKNDDATFFRSEVEYILHGDKSEKENENNIYLKIYGIRMVNNLIAMYKNQGIRDLSLEASSWAGPFAPLVQIAIIAILAALETYFDMQFLITYGYKIPFWKSSKQLTLSLDNILNKFENSSSTSNIKSLLQTPNCSDAKFLVSYETYLWFFMLLTGKERKLLRSADLMQLNIRLTDESYIMANHYTYVRCYTKATIKPMFVGLGFAPSQFDKFNKRYDIESLNYQGY